MPKGIPVATVGINASANAALLAVEIIALRDQAIRQKLIDYRKKMSEDVLAKDKKLKEIGVDDYLKGSEGH